MGTCSPGTTRSGPTRSSSGATSTARSVTTAPSPTYQTCPAPCTWSGATGGLPWPERRLILTVGRFFTGGHNKRQDVVIEAFRRMQDLGLEGVELALAGSIHPSPRAGSGSMSSTTLPPASTALSIPTSDGRNSPACTDGPPY